MRATTPLTLDQVREAAPAVFQKSPHTRTTERYTPISTEQALRAMQANGLGISRAQQKLTRAVGAMPYARHLVCLRPLDAFLKPKVGGIIPEVVLINGHDGYTSYQVYAGMYRLICANGMILGDTFAHYSIAHRGDIVEEVLEASRQIWESVPRLYDWIKKAQTKKLSAIEQLDFAKNAMGVRFKDRDPFKPDELLRVRRPEDQGPSLWTVYNRVQENLMQGGIEGRSATNRRVLTKPIARVTKDVEYNQELWELANQLLAA